MRQLTISALALLVLALLISSLTTGSLFVSAAPMPAITPVAATNPVNGAVGNVLKFFDARAITADTRVCIDAPQYRVLDLQYVIDQGTTNTTTLKLQHSNDNSNFSDGQTIVSANAADASALNRFDLYGRYNCVYGDVANSNTITITAYGVPRQ